MADFSSGRSWRAYASPGPKPISESAKKKLDELAANNARHLVQADRIGGWPKGFEYFDLKTFRDNEVGMTRIEDDDIRTAFESAQYEANENSQKEAPSSSPQVDQFLHMGGLYNKGCAYALEVATGEKIVTEDPSHDEFAIHYGLSRTYLYWSAEKVKQLSESADWNAVRAKIEKNKSPIAILHSARAFLETCAAMNLGIRFASD